MKIDLGQQSNLEVVYSGKSYLLREPTAKDVVGFQKASKVANDDEQMDCFNNFLINLGLPQDVCESLSINKLKQLSEAIIGTVSEKK